MDCPTCGVPAKIRERDPDVFEEQCPQCGLWLYPEDTSPAPNRSGDATQFSTTIEGFTLCSVEPFTDEEKEALGAYFRLLRKKRDRERRVVDLDGG
jgi:Zn-finger nucleic acid-binding protein